MAAQVDLTADGGAYAYTSTKVLGNALLACLGPYAIPNVDVTGRVVYTNNCPSGAFRGFGGAQGHFAAEMQVNKLAEALGMDPVELRMRNALREGSKLPTRSAMPPGCTIVEVLEEAAKHGGWEQAQGEWQRQPEDIVQHAADSSGSALTSLDATRKRTATGIGIAACLKNVGFSLGFPESCEAWVELHGGAEIERAVVGCVGADVGQGAHTVFLQIAAETLGIDPERIELSADSSDVTGSSGSTSASRMTFMAGNAIKGAAELALQHWEDEERPARVDYVYRPRATTGYNRETGEGDPNITYGYCAQVAEVEVDLETGHVFVKRLISVNDVGKAINPQQIEGQIEGAVAQSMGWTLLENLIQKDGHILTQQLSTYLVPGVQDVAEVIEPVILEIPDPQGPLGARGMGEMPFIPTAPAIGAAIANATGVWLDSLPYTPEKVWQALQE